ncbi:hypothetical protein [Clostridium kluyveri]|uniref:Uncharacterized protein n=1 Tax=Clostridium kluyveri TaxID=1534 RepID=A0A1L5FC30_CLOKL|nr:hypothetical protein [Clostridium kluyveri]APM40496.1 hypothetical protein BS101_18065 [Clostridium kluyveri]APM40562.1 hypothetical protein BS101_18450 [Clostridium kluyveri]
MNKYLVSCFIFTEDKEWGVADVEVSCKAKDIYNVSGLRDAIVKKMDIYNTVIINIMLLEREGLLRRFLKLIKGGIPWKQC